VRLSPQHHYLDLIIVVIGITNITTIMMVVINQSSCPRPKVINGCKIGLIQFCLSAPKTNMENSVVVQDYAQIDRILKEERKYVDFDLLLFHPALRCLLLLSYILRI
jgi:hypothetical protein